MAICQIMIGDFIHNYGRYDETGYRYYSDDNLEEGIAYTEGLIEDGFTHCPMNDYNLKTFKKWCKLKLVEEKNESKS